MSRSSCQASAVPGAASRTLAHLPRQESGKTSTGQSGSATRSPRCRPRITAIRLRLGAFGDRERYRKHLLDLGGLGVRDLCPDGDDLLVLAGPSMALSGPVRLYRWHRAAHAETSRLVRGAELTLETELAHGAGEAMPRASLCSRSSRRPPPRGIRQSGAADDGRRWSRCWPTGCGSGSPADRDTQARTTWLRNCTGTTCGCTPAARCWSSPRCRDVNSAGAALHDLEPLIQQRGARREVAAVAYTVKRGFHPQRSSATGLRRT